MSAIVGFVFIILGATGVASVFGWGGLIQFILITATCFILWRARQLQRTKI